MEGIVHERVVDQPLPADRGARLLEIHAHDEIERIAHLLREFLEPRGVLLRGLDVVNRAWPDNDEQARVLAVEDAAHGLAPAQHRGLGAGGEWQLVLHLLRRWQQVLRQHVDVVDLVVTHGSLKPERSRQV